MSLFGLGGGEGLFSGGSIWPAAIMAGSQLISGLFGNDGSEMTENQSAQNDLANREFAYQQQADAAKLAQQLELARISAGAAGAGARAQVAAANISANAQIQAMKQRAAEALMTGRLNAITATKPDLLTESSIAATKARQAAGDAAMNGFQNFAGLLQRPMLQTRTMAR